MPTVFTHMLIFTGKSEDKKSSRYKIRNFCMCGTVFIMKFESLLF